MHLNNDGTYIFTSNLVYFLNDFIFSKSIWLTEDDNATVGKDDCKQGFDSSVEVKHNNSIDYNNNVVSNEKVIEKYSDFLRILRVKNVNRLIIVNLNINYVLNKFGQLKLFVQGTVDILIVTETELDSTFPTSQFVIDGYSEPKRFGRNSSGVEFLFIFDKTYQANYKWIISYHMTLREFL